jgi:hypothetical protein
MGWSWQEGTWLLVGAGQGSFYLTNKTQGAEN